MRPLIALALTMWLTSCATLGIAQPPPFDDHQQEVVIRGLSQLVDLVPGAGHIVKMIKP
jgi:hypothetical protein